MRLRTFKNSAAVLLGASVLLLSPTLFAGVSMNTMCYLAPKQSQAQAFNPTAKEIAESGSALLKAIPTNVTAQDVQTPFRIASLSKLFLSHWAITSLGPNYRFETKIHVTAGSQQNTCNLHFEGDGDPVMGREMLNEVFPQLKSYLDKQNCTEVETVSFDENLRVFLDVLSHQKSGDALRSFAWSNPAAFDSTSKTQNDLTAFLKHRSGLKVNLEKVGMISKQKYSDYRRTVPGTTLSFKSRPLYMILKELNKYSHNYIPNVIFNRLGGVETYEKFLSSQLKISKNEVTILNGSGYPYFTFSGEKLYNLASCSALVRVLEDTEKQLQNFKGPYKFQLADIMPIGGDKETYSTFKSLYSASTFDNTIAAKTGSAERAITFGGVISTDQGNLYFGVMTAPDNYGGADLSNAREYIRDLVTVLAERQKLKSFDYQVEGVFKAFDEQSKLVLLPATGLK